VREKNDTISLQVKSLVKNIDGGPSVHREIEKKIDSVPEHIDAETVKDMTGITTVGAFKVGELTTQRRICHRGEKSNIEICLDKSDYLGITDYELELEYTGDALSQVMDIVNDLSLSPQKQPEGKMSRFYKRYKQLH
jgi:uncharacterized protein YjbK